MSGGHFDYYQFHMNDIVSKIEEAIENEISGSANEWGDATPYGFSEETINEFKRAIDLLKLAEIYTQRIDWLLSGDDGEDSFHERLSEDKNKLFHEVVK